MALSGQPSNFAHLRVHDDQLVRLGQLALTSQADLDAAKPLILMAYEGRAAFAASKATPTSGI
jgi:hypothetical protein